MMKDNNTRAFLALVKAGLWEKEIRLLPFGKIDLNEIYRISEEQSVVGVVAVGLEHVTDVKASQEVLMKFIGSTLRIEKWSRSMNEFIPTLFRLLKDKDVKALLVKGQGVAQCYDQPLRRSAGDIDLLLDAENYERAKELLFPQADDVESEDRFSKHQALKLHGFVVELHGRMPFALSRRVDKVIDEVLEDAVKKGGVDTWRSDGVDVLIPNPDNHLFLVFTHFLHHFFIEGVGLRQISDWCRMLWRYREDLDIKLLESRIRRAGLLTEWKAFAALAVDFLGMPIEAMPFYDERYSAKGHQILKRVISSGNMGHNRDMSYRTRYKGATYKIVATWRRFLDFVYLFPIFPGDSPRFFVRYVTGKV